MDKEIKQELEENIKRRIVASVVLAMVEVAITGNRNPANAEEEGNKSFKRMEDKARKDAADIIDLVTKTIEAGKIPEEERANG